MVHDAARNEDRLRNEIEKLQSLLDNTGKGIVVLCKGRIVFCNPRLCSVTGRTSEEFLSRDPGVFVHLDDLEDLLVFIGRLSGVSEEKHFSFRCVAKSGDVLWVNGAGVCMEWEGESATALYLTLPALQRGMNPPSCGGSQDWAEVDNAPYGVQFYELQKGGELVLTGANCAADRIFGLDHAQLLDRDISQIFPDLAGTDILEAYRRVAVMGEGYTHDRVTSDQGIVRKAFEVSAFQNAPGSLTLTSVDITARKQMERELRQSEERFQLAMEASQDGIWDWEVASGTVYYSPGYAAILGYSSVEVPAHVNTWEDLIHPEDKARALKANIDCIENRSEMFTVEFRMQTKSGEWRWILGRGKAVSRDTTGRANRMVGTHTDITERKQTEEALKESEERFFKAFTANPGPMVISEIDSGRFIDVNERWLKMLGHTREETIGHTSLELGIWADPDHRRRSTSVMYSDGHFSDVLTEFITKSGEIRWALWSAVSIVLRGRELMLSLLYDITERKRAEDQLREMQQLLEAAVAQSPSGILIADAPDVSLRIANTAAEAMILGEAGERTSAGALSGSSAQWQTFHPDGSLYPFEQLPLSRAVLHGQTTHNEELVIRDIHGKEHWVSANAAPILNIRGDIVAGIVVFQEITKQKRAEEERQRLEEQFHQAQKLESVGRLAGGVAHDLNNMLVPIIGYGEILLSEALENDPRIEPLEQIVSAGKKARDLVSQLLAFSRKQTLTPRILDLNTLLKDFEKLIRRTIRESIAIHFELEEPLPSVRGDQGQLEQVLMNLAVNAQDAMPEGGELKFETSGVTVKKSDSTTLGGVPPGSYVMLCVTDNGCGMDPDVQDHLFEPFFTTKEQDKGTGLGLATVYGIVKQHGGHVHVSSQPAQGASFRIFLPVSKGTPVQHDQAPTLQAAELAGTETILLVEDNDHVRDLLHAILEKNGYTILVARSGNEALSILEGHRGPVDMLLTDVIMPGMNGEQLHNRMKEIYPKIKTLFVSGHPKDVISESGVIREGINFIQKPFSVSTIETALRKILENGSD